MLRALSCIVVSSLSAVHGASTITLQLNDQVCVVGGGAAGVHYASLLAKKGLTNIQLLEAGDQVGGKSHTLYDDAGNPQEMGTVFALDTYTPIFDLVNQYDPSNARFEFAFEQQNYMACMGESVGARDADSVTTMDFPQYLLRSVQVNAALPPNATDDQLRALMRQQTTQYIALHRRLFGIYPYGMPPQPKEWSEIDMTALEFLTRHNLTALVGMFRFFQQQQGYGILETIPAFYFLWWSHPTTVQKVMGAQLLHQPCAYEFMRGFQSIWLAIANAHRRSINTLVRTRVTSVTRGDGAFIKPTVAYETAWGETGTLTCDHVVMAVDLSLYASLVTDLTPDEQALFVGTYTSSTFATTLYESEPSPVETATQIWLTRMHENGRVSSLRNAKLSMPLPSARSRVEMSTGRQVRVAYQYYSTPLAQVNRAETTRVLKADLTVAGMPDPLIWKQMFFNYFPRFTADGLKAGLPWKIWDIQGDRRTTWIGSSVCFESALDVVTYNNNLIQRIQVVVANITT
ncbi:Aste57867_19872 [Aphanomyces stellatus]|uniref:Aste57867_19872 protein n=1 Tax=Aphanomyces stellatus TaxID=120398 RepID=A0A485LET7_9STRA|nr:hypothetical protein As57867_019806 [Aphanomyces stellatus]VFT96570.1 Aste57867_19872 [Aphanomyces stellatus]